MKRFRLRRTTIQDIDGLVHQRHMMSEDLRRRTDEEHSIGDKAYRRWAKSRLESGRLVVFLIETT